MINFFRRITDLITNNTAEIIPSKFQLKCLNVSGNKLTEHFLLYQSSSLLTNAQLYNHILEYFSHLRLVSFSSNKFKHLSNIHMKIFSGTVDKPSQLEALLIDSNQLSSIRHDTFYDLKQLKYLTLNNNRLKLIHPLSFSLHHSQIRLLNLANNKLKAFFFTPTSFDIENSNITIDPEKITINNDTSIKSIRFIAFLFIIVY
jgi:hypothetical protein